jgi:hypothetical protein
MIKIKRSKTTIVASALALFVVAAAVSQLVAQVGVKYKHEQGQIAFVSGVDVYTVNPDGSDLKQLTNFGASGNAQIPSWSSDGEKLVFGFASAEQLELPSGSTVAARSSVPQILQAIRASTHFCGVTGS